MEAGVGIGVHRAECCIFAEDTRTGRYTGVVRDVRRHRVGTGYLKKLLEAIGVVEGIFVPF